MATTKKQHEQLLAILKQVYTHGPVSRVDIAHNTGITQAITGKLVAQLIDEHALQEVGETAPTRPGSGRRRTLLALRGEQSYYIGSELSEWAFTFSLIDNAGKVVRQEHRDIDVSRRAIFINASNYRTLLDDFITECAPYHPVAIGIALPGHFNASSHNIWSSHPLWREFDLKTATANLPLPVFMENNVHCMAIAAHLVGKPHPGDNFTFFHVGRGIFSSYMHNGAIHGADNYIVGEIGHTIVNPAGQLCECGRRGCLQTYSSEGIIIRHAQTLFRSTTQTYLRQIDTDASQITIQDVLRAYSLGDDGVTNILDNAMKYIAQTVNNLSIMLDSQHLVLHGRIFQPESLAKLLTGYIRQNAFLINGTTMQPVTIAPYGLNDGADAAAVMALERRAFVE
ncbi:ROK family protein [Lacticaseibacillus pabuli]|uniref:ROK family protein n=1 Tax=Lacticaseibacillus pabuli TaxID=3025672 RepID=A0ABY7WRS3_9LACO|nr:ROK family protein [Lacticaseibacillus sp. KACC 23028]WDF82421.1 ROK family protein [Lacticaseibacillus sp. KACC 23028]